MSRTGYSDTERGQCVKWLLEGQGTIDKAEHPQLDQLYFVGAKTTNHENLMLRGVEMDARKPVK